MALEGFELRDGMVFCDWKKGVKGCSYWRMISPI
jgi:hypothetical protein